MDQLWETSTIRLHSAVTWTDLFYFRRTFPFKKSSGEHRYQLRKVRFLNAWKALSSAQLRPGKYCQQVPRMARWLDETFQDRGFTRIRTPTRKYDSRWGPDETFHRYRLHQDSNPNQKIWPPDDSRWGPDETFHRYRLRQDSNPDRKVKPKILRDYEAKHCW